MCPIARLAQVSASHKRKDKVVMSEKYGTRLEKHINVRQKGKKTKNALSNNRVPTFTFKDSGSYACRIAETFEDSCQAYHLVFQEYLERGYCDSKFSQLHYTYYCVLPKSRTFLLSEKGKPHTLGTVSLVLDSPCGFPIESLFCKELSQLRKKNRRLAEVTLLAISDQRFGNKIFSLTNAQKLNATFHLFRALFTYARSQKVTDLIIAVNPKHEKLYQSLTFKAVGTVRPYSGACGHPALLMHLDIVRFLDVRFHERPVQRYFLAEWDSNQLAEKPSHWNPAILDRLFDEDQPLPDESFSIFRTYLKASHLGLTYEGIRNVRS